MEVYLQVRRAHFDEGRSKRSIARDFGLARGTVDKMCAFAVPPGYRREEDVRRPKLDGFTDTIDAWLLKDLEVPKKRKPTPRAVWWDDLATVYRVSLRTHTRTPPALKYCRSLTRAVDVVGRMTRRSGSLRKAIEMARRWRRLPVAMRFRGPSFTIGVIGTSTGCLGAMGRSFCAFFPLRVVRVQIMGRGHHRLA